ncbi:MAG: ParB/RepB/Spo0J family partition protein [Chloroflexi bacterium]|nr:ParB/RepB/Spo0J family partition protein [Chloroflexota bacterium]
MVERSLLELPLSAVEANPDQPRQFLDPKGLEELAASIRENGVLQPILVRRTEPGQYTLVAGERRWRAAQMAGLDTVPAIVDNTVDTDALILALVENIQRQDLTPLEEAHAYQRLVESGLTQEQIAKDVGKSRSAVSNALRLLQLPTPVRMSLAGGEITEGHARAILGAPSEAQQIRLWERVRERNLTVRQTETAAKQLRVLGAGAASEPQVQPGDLLAMERLRAALSTKVMIERRRKGGRIVIQWYDDEMLEAIVNTITADQGRAQPVAAPESIDI